MKRDRILVSIVMPVFNTPDSPLRNSINSILMQTYKYFELLIIDDGSGDDCASLLDSIQKQDKRIIVFHQGNCGVSAARNYGISKATGMYIAFVDSDDLVFHNWLSVFVDAASKENADVICGKLLYSHSTDGINLNKTLERRQYVFLRDDVKKVQMLLLAHDFKSIPNIKRISPSQCGKLIRRSLLDNVKFDTSLVYGEDQVFMHQIIPLCNKVVYNDENVYVYLQNDYSTVHTFNKEWIIPYMKALLRIRQTVCRDNEIRNAMYYNEISRLWEGQTIQYSLCSSRRTSLLRINKQAQEYFSMPFFQESINNIDLSAFALKWDKVRIYFLKKRIVTPLVIYQDIVRIYRALKRHGMAIITRKKM